MLAGKQRIDDETYKVMSSLAYDNHEKGMQPAELKGWIVEDTENKIFSGLDAVTFVNPETKQAVIAFRGTEGDQGMSRLGPDLLNDAGIGIEELKRKTEFKYPFDEQLTRFEDATGITAFKDFMGDTSKKIDKFTSFPGTNQMYQAEDYTREMMSKYKDYEFSLTGHSLGGANAQYAAAYTGADAVTFSAPSVIGSLTPEFRRRAENGEFDSQIINYAHPGDIIASGALGGFDGHVGSTYYIDSSYTDANKGLSMKEKIENTLGGPHYHQLDRYTFENGYISNPLYDGKTDRMVDSPRLPYVGPGILDELGGRVHSMAGSLSGFAAGGLAGLASLLAGTSGASAGTIQVTPAELRSVAERWKKNAHQSRDQIEGIRQRLGRFMFSSHSRRLQPMIQQLDVSIVSMSQWHLQQTSDIVFYIQHKADQFEQADNTG